MISVLVNGCNGNMGKEVIRGLQNHNEITLIGQTGKNDNLGVEIDAKKAGVVVDFTHPSSVFDSIMTIVKHGAYAVVGTTGISQNQKIEIDAFARQKNKAVLLAPNFCIGAILMMKFAAQAARYMPHVEIVEYHHDQKADTPSGTALYTAHYINAHAGMTKDNAMHCIEQGEENSRGATIGNIKIHAVRLPGYIASQEVILGDKGHTLKIRHDAIHRESFLPGVILAIKEIMNHQGLIEGLEKFL